MSDTPAPLEYATVEQGRDAAGLRLVLTAGVPGPWGQAAKFFFEVKGVPFLPVRQEGGEESPALRAWTGHENAPQAVLDDEPARTTLLDILFLAERLGGDPPLVPERAALRAEMFGCIDLMAAPEGLGWQRRLQMLHGPVQAGAGATGPVALLARRYGYSPEAAGAAPGRIADLLGVLAARLHAQAERGSDYLVGDRLSAADLVWAAFSVLIRPLPEDVCPMPHVLRLAYDASEADLDGALDPALLRHRDTVYERYLELPLRF